MRIWKKKSSFEYEIEFEGIDEIHKCKTSNKPYNGEVRECVCVCVHEDDLLEDMKTWIYDFEHLLGEMAL